MLAASAGERLRTLRALLGITQSHLAEATGISQGWISGVETGDTEPSEQNLRRIAEVTDTPIGFFAVRPNTVPLDSLRFLKRASASKTVTKRIHAFYGEAHRVAEDLTGEAAYPPPPLPYATKEDLSGDEIEELAEQTRQALRLAPGGPIPHLTRALERAGVAVAPIRLPELPASQDASEDAGSALSTSEHFGVSYWAGLGEVALIGYFPGQQGDRDRFALAHEVGHIVLHTFRPRAPDAEKEAHRFAGALLVPRRRVEQDFSASLSPGSYARLKATWGVSIASLVMRAHEVGVISDSRKRSLFVQMSQNNWRRNEPVTVGQEHPLLIWRLLSRRFPQRTYLAGADGLSIHAAVLRSIAPTPDRPAAQHRPPGAVVDVDARRWGNRRSHDEDEPNGRLGGA